MPITLHTEAAILAKLPEQDELMLGRSRDDFQKQVDRDVELLKIVTARAGWPEPGTKGMPFHRYVVGKDDKAELNAVIRRAGTLHKVEIDFFKPVTTEGGHVAIKFNVSRKLDKDDKPVKDDTLHDNGKSKHDARVDKEGKWVPEPAKPRATA